MKSSPEMSKYRQTLHLQAARWDAQAAEAEATKRQLSAFNNPALAAEIAFCRGEAEKCRQALKKVRGRTKQQQRAGW